MWLGLLPHELRIPLVSIKGYTDVGHNKSLLRYPPPTSMRGTMILSLDFVKVCFSSSSRAKRQRAPRDPTTMQSSVRHFLKRLDPGVTRTTKLVSTELVQELSGMGVLFCALELSSHAPSSSLLPW